MTQSIRRVLVTGPSGQLGRALVASLVEDGYKIRALIHNRPLNIPGVKCIRGNISDLASVRRATKNIDAVCHLATTKEDPDTFIDVSIRGTYNLLQAARENHIQRFILAGSDAAMGIYYYDNKKPINETLPHRAYPGVYALSKVLEEVLGQQFHIQYNLPYVCLRISWILHEDMILRHLSASAWTARLGAAQKKLLRDGRERAVILLKKDRTPLIRHVVALDDVVQAFLLALKAPDKKVCGQTFHIAAPRPFSYLEAANHLARRMNIETLPIIIPEAHDFQIDITKARRTLHYRPALDIRQIIDRALEWRQHQT